MARVSDDVAGDSEVVPSDEVDVVSLDSQGDSDDSIDAACDQDAPPADNDAPDGDSPRRSAPRSLARRRSGFAVARALVVLVVAAVGYQLVVPQTHVVRSRLARLVISDTGVKGFAGKPKQQGPQAASSLGIAALTSASKATPNKAGAYDAVWTPSSSTGAAVYALLLPDVGQSATALTQVHNQQLAKAAYAADGFTEKDTFTIPGASGSAGVLYGAPAATKTSAGEQLAVAVASYGRVVVVADVEDTSGAQGIVVSLTTSELAHLRSVEPGFSLKVVSRSGAATAAWVAVAVALALLVALGPAGWRARGRRRDRRIQEELAHQVIVGSRVINKRRA
jgi:hypothetical protein